MINREFLLDLICEKCDVSNREVFGKSRKKNVVLAREVFGYFARYHLGMRFVDIGKFFGKHHSTVIHWCDVIKDYLTVKDEIVCNVISQVENKIKEYNETTVKLSVICPINANIFEIGEFLAEKYGCKVIRE